MKRLILFLLFLFAAYPARAQQATGNITSGAGCGATSGPGCVVLGLPTNVSSVSVAVGGNFSANLAVQQSADGGNSWTSAGAAITSGSTTNYTIKAQNQFRVCAAPLCGGSYVSGTAFVSILYSTAASGGGGSGITSLSCASGCSVANPTTTPAITVSAGGGGIGGNAVAWRKVGTVTAGGPTSATVAEEMTVFPQPSPQVISDLPTGANVLGSFFTLGWTGGASLIYQESPDNGLTWTPSAISISAHAHSCAATIGGTIYVLAANAPSGTNGIDIYSFASGTATLVKANIVTSGGGHAWKATSLANCGFIHDNQTGNYDLWYDGQSAGSVWSIGFATCTAPSGAMSCTDYASNPVLAAGDPKSVKQLTNGSFIMWPQIDVGGILPSDVFFATGSSTTSWTLSTNAAVWRTLPIEGVNTAVGQLADFDPLTIGSECYAWYTEFPSGSTGVNGGVGYAVANLPCEQFTSSTVQSVSESIPVGLSAYGVPLASRAGPVSLTTGMVVNITSLTVPPGSWELNSSGVFEPSGNATIQDAEFCISLSNTSCNISGLTFPEVIDTIEFGTVGVPLANGYGVSANTGAYRVQLNATTTYYVDSYQEFSAGSLAGYASITAQRTY